VRLAGRPIHRNPAALSKVDAIVTETTYGNRPHKAIGPSVEELYAAIDEAFRRGGNVIIPTLALERAQELLSFMHADQAELLARHGQTGAAPGVHPVGQSH